MLITPTFILPAEILEPGQRYAEGPRVTIRKNEQRLQGWNQKYSA